MVTSAMKTTMFCQFRASMNVSTGTKILNICHLVYHFTPKFDTYHPVPPLPHIFCTNLSAHKTKRRLDSHRLTFITAFTQNALCDPVPIKSTRLFQINPWSKLDLYNCFLHYYFFPYFYQLNQNKN